MRKYSIDRQPLGVFALCLIALFLYIKTNDDPLLPFLDGSCIEFLFLKWETGNSLTRDLSIGFLVSIIFWIFNVYLPSNRAMAQKKGRLNRALFLILESFQGNPYHHDKHYIHCRELSFIDLEAIKTIKDSLDKKEIYGSLGEKAFYEICSESYDLFKFLSIAANEISPMHGALWDSITRNITVIGRMHDQWSKDKAKDGYKIGVDYSKGTLWLNLTEILESMEKWMGINK